MFGRGLLKEHFRGSDKNNVFGRGLLKEHFCKTRSETAIKANFHLPITSQWKLKVAIAMKAHEHEQ